MLTQVGSKVMEAILVGDNDPSMLKIEVLGANGSVARRSLMGTVFRRQTGRGNETPGRVDEGKPASLPRSHLLSPRAGTAGTSHARFCAPLPSNPRSQWGQSRFEPGS